MNSESPTTICIPDTIVNVKGILNVTTVPMPSLLSKTTVPPTFSTFDLTTSIPTPLPEYSVTVSLVEKPGSMRNWNISLGV
ncbi:hypothetical protein DSECCO2_574790 [anaerobic digester metagenome]